MRKHEGETRDWITPLHHGDYYYYTCDVRNNHFYES